MNVAAIIVNYRTPEHVGNLLTLLADEDTLSEICVVDNQPLRPFETTLPNVSVRVSDRNLGFGNAVNLALREVSSDWVLLINPDVRPEPGCIASLVATARSSGSPLLGPRFYWDKNHQFRLPPATPGSVWFFAALNCARTNHLEAEILDHYWTTQHDRFWGMKSPFFEPFLSGACLLADRSRLAHGPGELLDPSFFLYFEDTDLCARALSSGCRPLCVPQAEAVHFWNQSPEPDQSKAKLMADSRAAYLNKHFAAHRLARIHGPPIETNFEHLGSHDKPLEVSLGAVGDSDFLELSFTGTFVPFAQARLEQDKFRFADAVWRNLGPGTYFVRSRSHHTGIRRTWTFDKI